MREGQKKGMMHQSKFLPALPQLGTVLMVQNHSSSVAVMKTHHRSTVHHATVGKQSNEKVHDIGKPLRGVNRIQINSDSFKAAGLFLI